MKLPFVGQRGYLYMTRSLLWRFQCNNLLGMVSRPLGVTAGFNRNSALNYSSWIASEDLHSPNLLVPGHMVMLNQVRNHWRQRRSKQVPYTKPLNFDFAGDLDMSTGAVDLKSPKVSFEDVPELLNAGEDVKKVFSLEYSQYGEVMDKKISEMLKKVRDHPLDLQSLEVKIAKLTIQIRRNVEHCLRFRHDKVTKQRLIRMINVRKSMLRRLQMDDIDKFNWLTQELNLRLVEKPEGFKWPSKAEKRKEAATQAALSQARAKTEKLKAALDEQKVVFQVYKEQELAEIEQEMKELGLSEQHLCSLEAALTALDRAHLIPRPAPIVSREEQLRQRLLEKNMPLKKQEDDTLLRLHGFYTPDELKYYPEPQPPTPMSTTDEESERK